METKIIKAISVYFLEDTLKLIEEILKEAKSELSAVAAHKRLSLYIKLMKDIDINYSINSVKELILQNAYGEEFYNSFEEKREDELKIYQGNPELD